MKRAIIQGVRGSFHEEAAQKFFSGEKLDIVQASSFSELMRKFDKDPNLEYAVIAIENSIAGSILHNYKLIQESQGRILGEIYLRIEQNLLVNYGVKMEDIREVQSHPMALKQCSRFLHQYPDIRLVETPDTALSAAEIQQNASKTIAAIGSFKAAEFYNLNIIKRGIETQKNNYTRFFVLHKDVGKDHPSIANKASIYFRVKHKAGSLASALQQIASEGVNLSKIQSFPVPDLINEYFIHVDMEYDNVKQYRMVMTKLHESCLMVCELGAYKKARII